ncbi:hypothetical protein BDV93DRAFT_510724 [Ceratobasidium sp. AG-I]|nr:hypothetical protein BDV93DRAFT_510724 [Ceratobasidium sp. AG-I]
MSAFTRIAVFAALMLSLSYLVSAIPTPAITGTDAVSLVCAKLFLELEVKIKALLGCGTVTELTVIINALVALFQGCADELLKLGAGAVVSVEAQASIVACFAATITLLVKVCAAVSVKFGLTIVLVLFAKLDVVLQLCLVNLNTCIGGILVLIAKAIASATFGVMAQVHLKLCLSLFGITGLGL